MSDFDKKQDDWMKRQQEQNERDADRARRTQRDLDLGQDPGKPQWPDGVDHISDTLDKL